MQKMITENCVCPCEMSTLARTTHWPIHFKCSFTSMS